MIEGCLLADNYKEMIFVTTGRSKATAHINGWKLPSIMVWFASKYIVFDNVCRWITSELDIALIFYDLLSELMLTTITEGRTLFIENNKPLVAGKT